LKAVPLTEFLKRIAKYLSIDSIEPKCTKQIDRQIF